MSTPVLAVFSGTQLDPTVFQRALALAQEQGAALLLLDVRHRHQAHRLGEFLEAGSPLGRATIRALQQSVKQQRDSAIGRALQSLIEEAQAAGVQVTEREEKGEFAEVVTHVVDQVQASAVVLSERSPGVEIQSNLRVFRV